MSGGERRAGEGAASGTVAGKVGRGQQRCSSRLGEN